MRPSRVFAGLFCLWGLPALAACPPESTLGRLGNAALGAHVASMLDQTRAYFGTGFDHVCLSETLANARADVPARELTIGLRFLHRYNRPDDRLTVSAMLAHETAHAWQFDNGWFDRPAGRALTLRCVELHADFLAGGFVYWHLDQNGLSQTDPASLLYGLAGQAGFQPRMGDHHGLPQERDFAFESGYRAAADRNLEDFVAQWPRYGNDLSCLD